MQRKANSYAEFWPSYLAEHSRPATRSLHFAGTGLGLALLAAALLTQVWWLLPAALVSGYAFAWIAHIAVEHNRPATFSHPLWSLISDFRMFFIWLGGRLETELSRHGIAAKD
ncbi:MAG: DUF962 domain-containing protein [Rhodovibrionaceae bacterium]